MASSNYAIEETQALIENYQRLREAVTASPRRLWLLVRLMDLDAALDRVPFANWIALELCGVQGFTRQQAGALLGLNEKTLDRRYRAGLLAMTEHLNGN